MYNNSIDQQTLFYVKNMKKSHEKLLVIDFGSQYAHLICRRIRELKVRSELIPWDRFEKTHLDNNIKGLILSGGPRSIHEEDAPNLDSSIIHLAKERRIPILGICYGHQLLAHLLGGKVIRGKKREYGPATLNVYHNSKLLNGLPRKMRVWMSHGDLVTEVPKGFRVIGKTENCPIAAYESTDELFFGVQFHPEVRHTEHGIKILDNFLEICGFRRDWVISDVIQEKIKEIRDKVGDSLVLLAASGGVDSTVTGKLIHEAIGEKLHLIFINTGFMREGEERWVLNMLRDLEFNNIHYVDASEKFLKALIGVSNPEDKRRLFAKMYSDVLASKAKELEKRYGKFRFLAQGTIYPDRVESGATSSTTDKIKSHHNVVMPIISSLEKLEPLADFYKDEVRKIAKILGIPREVWSRHPFPGPGLLVRILGRVTENKLEIARKAHKIIEEEAKKWGIYDDLWQIFPVVLDSKAVGVKGDARSYEHIIAIRAVKSEDAMTAEFAKLPWEFLEHVARRITNEINGVNRVLYDITHKPPATIEFE